MDCETFQLDLPDLLYGELDGDRQDKSQAHASGCSSCASLLGELQAVRAAQATHVPSPLLTSRVKLAARDALLGEGEPRAAPWSRGGPVQVLATALLAACVGLVAFALGIAYERGQHGEPVADEPRLTVPKPADLVQQDQPEWLVEISAPAGADKPIQVPRAPTAWQRVLHDAASAHLEKGDHPRAREFFLKATAVAPEGPLAAACRVGAAEAVLRVGERRAALQELDEVRKKIIAGKLAGSPALLHRITELMTEADPPPPEDR